VAPPKRPASPAAPAAAGGETEASFQLPRRQEVGVTCSRIRGAVARAGV